MKPRAGTYMPDVCLVRVMLLQRGHPRRLAAVPVTCSFPRCRPASLAARLRRRPGCFLRLHLTTVECAHYYYI